MLGKHLLQRNPAILSKRSVTDQ